MPEISRFLGIIIAMYYKDHRTAHFHAKYGNFEALIEIETGGVLRGHLPPRVLGLVQEWRELYKGDLLQDWQFAEARKPLRRIKPLE